MNRSSFSKTKYMIGVGFKKLARTPVPKLPPGNSSRLFKYNENLLDQHICYEVCLGFLVKSPASFILTQIMRETDYLNHSRLDVIFSKTFNSNHVF